MASRRTDFGDACAVHQLACCGCWHCVSQVTSQLQSSESAYCTPGYTPGYNLLAWAVQYCTREQPQHKQACLDLFRSVNLAQSASDMLAQCVWLARHHEAWCMGSAHLGALMALLAAACSGSKEERQHFLRDPRLVPAALEAMRMHPWDWTVQRAGAEICSTRGLMDMQVTAVCGGDADTLLYRLGVACCW